MRVTLADPTLARQAGRFVWLELNFDNPANREFLVHHAVAYTPTMLVLDPGGERATASHLGGMTASELTRFLDRGAQGVGGPARSPADSALARGDELLGRGLTSEAAAGYRAALRLAAPGWTERGHALAQLTWALMADREARACAELAAAQAPRMPRDGDFVRVVLAGLTAANQADSAAWGASARATLVPLAAQAIEVREATRDHRFQLHQALMIEAANRNDRTTVTRWGERWLREIEAVVPRNDDERTALDVARVDVAGIMGSPERVLAALQASERAMPGNYNASLRLAQVEADAGRYDESLAACDRGLAHVDGPIGRTWLLETKAQVWMAKSEPDSARRALEQARRSAGEISTPANRSNNLQRISRMMTEVDRAAR